MEEQNLLNLAMQMDHKALVDIYDLYSPAIYRYAYRLSADAERAEECVSETFLRFINALQKRKGPREHLRAYLYMVAHNWIIDQIRKHPMTDAEIDENHLDENQINPADAVSMKLEQDRTRVAIQKLTADQQQVILLKFIEDWEYEEIAQTMDKTVGAVKSLQNRALATLQRTLNREEREHVHLR